MPKTKLIKLLKNLLPSWFCLNTVFGVGYLISMHQAGTVCLGFAISIGRGLILSHAKKL